VEIESRQRAPAATGANGMLGVGEVVKAIDGVIVVHSFVYLATPIFQFV
jgi:hypothetical protein